MKKLFYLLILFPLSLMMASCSDDDDLAQVDVSLDVTGVTEYNGDYYTVVGEEITLDNVKAVSLTSQPATIQRVAFFIDGVEVFGTIEDPFSASFSTEGFRIGTHVVTMTGIVLQVDKTMTQIGMRVPINVVESEEDLPEGAPEIGTVTITARMQ